MKKAVLLLGMVTLIAGCIYLKNADMDTVLFEEQVMPEVLYVEEYPIESTEEIAKLPEETTQEAYTVLEDLQEETVTEKVQSEETVQKNAGGYAFSKLSIEEQNVYVQILDSLLNYEEEITLTTTDAAVIDKAFSCVMLDHPEIFYIDGYKYTEYSGNGKVEKIVFSGNYLYEKTEKERREQLIEAAADAMLRGVPDTEDEYKKVKYLYDTIVNHTEYRLSSVDNQNICSVFLHGESVCQGYAKALQYLMHRLDMESVLVLGTVTGGEGHAWNLVLINDRWYHLDATWGDAFYLFSDEEIAVSGEEIGLINYDYLCVTTEQLNKTHQVNMPVELPQCDSMVDNYYVREGIYFTSFEEGRLREIFGNAAANGKQVVTIKCSNIDVYKEISRVLLDEQMIFEYLSREESIAFTDNQEQCSLTFWL